MAKNGLKLIDAEMHVMVPVDLWERYIDPEFAARATAAQRASMGQPVLLPGLCVLKRPVRHFINSLTISSAAKTSLLVRIAPSAYAATGQRRCDDTSALATV